MYIQIKQKMYPSIPYTAQIPAGTSFPDRMNLPYTLVELFSCCETNYSERKGNNPASNWLVLEGIFKWKTAKDGEFYSSHWYLGVQNLGMAG